MKSFAKKFVVLTLGTILLLPTLSSAQSPQVALAGVSYAGDAGTLDQRFPYSRLYEQSLTKAGDSPFARLQRLIAQTPPKNLTLVTTQVDELKGRDQALVTSLVLSSETVSVEQFGELRKLFVLIRGQALFFDFKSMTVVRAYPLSFAYIDTFDRNPTEAEVLDRVKQVYEGTTEKPGIYGRFANALSTAVVPAGPQHLLQVANINLSPSLLDALPGYLKSAPGVAQTWAADLVSEAISGHTGTPLIPYSKGYAIGNVMSMRVSDGTVYQLKLPKPDYVITVDFTGLKKIKFGEVAAGASFIYGSYATIRIEEPLLGILYLNTTLKNGETKVVPMTQSYVDDFPAFYDSINGMFKKLANALAGTDDKWVKVAAGAPDIESQLLKTREMMASCK